MTSIFRIKIPRPDPLPETLEKLAAEIQAQIARFRAEGDQRDPPVSPDKTDGH